jgi:homoserine dehydrogenase
MPSPRLTILKFGGSVLTSPAALDGIVQHIYRHVRDGEKVIAVVSAFAGETDRLFQLSHDQVADSDPGCVAAVAETGELYSAARLGLALDRAGVSVHVLHAGAIGLQAEGFLLDATPTKLDVDAVMGALQSASVLVVPGFVGRTAAGRTCLLGRGGSDLTAVFLAAELQAKRCVLVKDVDGLFDRDPAVDPLQAQRYDAVTSDEALQLDNSIMQHKAVRYAQACGMVFEVAGLLRGVGTLVGVQTTVLTPVRKTARPLRVALLGCGTVGEGVRIALGSLRHVARLVSISTRSNVDIDASLYVAPDALHPKDFDVLIEVTGAIESVPLVEAALRAGRTVITANKAVLAKHGKSLHALAVRHGGRLLGSASTGGGLPLLEVAAVTAGESDIVCVEALLNGSTNFVIDRIAKGLSLDEAIDQAVGNGLCEADPWRDLAGQDAADKLVVLHSVIAGSLELTVQIPTRSQAEAALVCVGQDPGQVRQVARWTRRKDVARAEVAFESLCETHPLAAARCEENIAVLHLADRAQVVIRGRGAGRWPTTVSVLGDLLQVCECERSAVERRT